MRIAKYLMIFVLLVGCSDISQDEMSNQVDNVVKKINESDAYKNHNHQKGLFSYYLPKNIGVKDANKISSVLLVDDGEIFMALNVSEIMNDKLEKINLNSPEFIISKEFETISNNDETINNKLVIEELEEDQYLIFLKVNEIFFVSSTPSAGISRILEQMLLVSRTIDIDKNKVFAQFSNKEAMDFEKEVIELFSESVPQDGFLRDIYESDKEDD